MAVFMAKDNEGELAGMTDWITNTINALQVQTRRRTLDAAMHRSYVKQLASSGDSTVCGRWRGGWLVTIERSCLEPSFRPPLEPR
jgi:hypothetical protein